MKIRSISRTAPELYLITYRRAWLLRWLGCVDRYVIVEPEEKTSPFPDGGENCTITKIIPFFYFRDSEELAHDCWHQIEWMIRNDVTEFDNSVGPDPDWPRPDMPYREDPDNPNDIPQALADKNGNLITNIPKTPPMPPVRNIPDFKNFELIPTNTQEVFTLDAWERREPKVFITPATTDQYDIDDAQKSIREITFEFAHQNGRREHVEELKPLVEYINKFLKDWGSSTVISIDGIISGLHNIMENLNLMEKT